jgi:hypothetical protein
MAKSIPTLQDILYRTAEAYVATLPNTAIWNVGPLSPLKPIRDADLMGNFAGNLEDEFSAEGLDIPYSSLDSATTVTDVALVISHLFQLVANNPKGS